MYKLLILYVFIVTIAFCHSAPSNDGMRVLGGTDAANGSAPYMVSLRDSNTFHFCGGSIISARTVLSAAHCLRGRLPRNVWARVGTNSLKDTAGEGTKYVGSQIIIHPDFSTTAQNNDLAVLITVDPIVFTATVKSILIGPSTIGAGIAVTLTGWGYTTYPGSFATDLQTINLKTLSYADCADKLSSVNTVYPTQLCTLTVKGEGSCHGDSGGPLVYSNAKYLVGLVSWGTPCALGNPDVFTRVSSFQDWIKNVTVA